MPSGIVPCVAVVMLATAACDGAPVFDRDVAPILRTYCSGCHNDRAAESGFSVERFATLRAGGSGEGASLVPGDAAASVLIRRIRSPDADHMPPPDEPQPSAADLATLEAWIAAGAAGPAADASILETLVVPRLPPSPAPPPVTALAVSPDAGRLAVARGRSVEILPLGPAGPSAAGPLLTIDDLPGPIVAVHYSADGTRLVVAGGITGLRGVVQIRDAATGALVRSCDGHRDVVYDAEFSPDGATLATGGYDRAVKFWNTSDGALVRSIDVHNGAVFDVAWHPSGRLLASASADETVKLWRTADGARLDTLSQAQGDVARVVFTPDGRHVVAAGRDRRVHLWKLVSLEAPAINPAVHARFAHEAPIVSLAVSPEGARLVTTAEDRTVKAWSLPDLELLAELPRQSDLAAAAVSRGEGFVLGTMDGRLVNLAGSARHDAPPTAAAVTAPRVVETADGDQIATALAEAEPNDSPAAATTGPVPMALQGAIDTPGDADCVRFAARAGGPLLVEVIAASAQPKSPVDSRVEILHADGRPVEQLVLQAVRDSWFTFRGKNSTQTSDFRLHNWQEMELDQYLYANGEVVRLWLFPRGPDSGFDVYPGVGARHTFFHTTAVTHALGEPAWIVEPLPPGAAPLPNGLPVFRIFFENDDEATRRLGTDSQLVFVPPADGDYTARITDVRGFGGDDYRYTLNIRPPRPAFEVSVSGKDPQVSPGGSRELTFSVTRLEGFAGPVRIEVGDLPAGFIFHGPVEIEAGQREARGVLSATPDAAAPEEAADRAVTVRAVALIAGTEVVRDLGTLGDIRIAEPAKVAVEIVPGTSPAVVRQVPGEPVEFIIRPGQTIPARVKVVRNGFEDRIEFGNEGSGRNLPHGVIIDNLGLNGLLIEEGRTEREFFISAAPKTAPGRRLFHLLAAPDGGQASLPAVLVVLPP